MGIKIHSNESTKKLIKALIAKNREPHSIVITGERGQGKKALAGYIAASLLCEKQSGEPCGECKSCRMIDAGVHPDFIRLSANENGNYKVDVIREAVSDAVIKPNESRFKVYLIPDLDRSVNTSTQVQNILLKLIEEPPEHCVIILTARTKEIFLETVLSRVLCLNTVFCSDDEVREYLSNINADGEYTDEQIDNAVRFSCGNIGRSVEFLEDEAVGKAVEIAKGCADAVCKGSEYDFLKAVFSADGKKALFRRVIELLREAVRDACVLRLGLDATIGCMPDESARLSQKLSIDTCRQIYEQLGDYIVRVDSNANLVLTMNSFASVFFK
ncbi:MAG: hypothetical protein IJU04_02610 [Ruminococcus sp.]|nr:hypothetical protein [Ruminococcus sp.]